MRALMGIQPINENKSNIVIELTKMGPDGNAYAIVRENHEWYIKRALKSTGLSAEDFKYIVGLMNKKDEAYPSYAKAIKHLNLKFKSLAEAYNFEGEINVFENDNLLSEDIAGFSEMKGNGFSGAGNMEENTALWEEEVEMTEAEEAVDRMLEGDKEFAALAEPKDKITYADKIAGAKKNETNEELKGKQKNLDVDKDGEIEGSDLAKLRNMNETEDLPTPPSEEEEKAAQVYESRFSIDSAIKNMDRLIENLTEGLKKKV
jgi:hypothetical protein